MTAIRSGLWRLGYKLSKEGKARFFDEFVPLLSRTKLEVLGERDQNSWYLNYIGTKPEGRGRGYARKLIEYVTKMVSSGGNVPEDLTTDVSTPKVLLVTLRVRTM
jgi:ribosomal protein S18 acetylase RimI-like enzyme